MNGIALGDLIAPDGIVFGTAGTNKRAVLQTLATQAATLAGRDADQVVDVILEREALGSTGFGGGTAIPHGRLPGLTRIVAVAAKLATPVDFAALDGLPVDLIVLMLAPADAGADHLKTLARVSRALRDTMFCHKLRSAAAADAFYALLSGDRRIEAA